MQDQEESKNQEIQEKQKQEDNGAMTKLQDVSILRMTKLIPIRSMPPSAPILG